MTATAPLTIAPRRSAVPRSVHNVYPVAAGIVIAVVAVLNVLYLLADCPLDLAPDEAHYWDWSRRLDWSYYSKGPLVAWLIRGSWEAFGGLSAALVGSEMLAVRLPAIGCQAVLLAAVYVLTSRTLRSPKLAFFGVLIAVTLPPVAAVGTVMTIDPPFLACWAWACVFAHSAALRSGGIGMWAAAGFAAILGVLAKYTMLMFPVCVAAYLWAVPGRRVEFRRQGYWVMCSLTAVGMLPILYWNARNDWVSFKHLFALAAGPADEPRPLLSPLNLLGYLAGQWGLLLGFWFQAFAVAAWVHRPGRCHGRHTAFLWWMSVPLWVFFAAASLRSEGQPNWPAPAYVSGLILALGWVADSWSNLALRRWLIGGLAVAATVGITLTFCAHYPAFMRSVLAGLVRPASQDTPAPIRKLDPISRLAGWRTLAVKVDRLRERVKGQDGQEPVLVGMVWTVPGELGFYCAGHPEAYSFGSAIADRRSQYDIWRPNPIADAQAFRGRTFLYVGERMPEMERAFDWVEPPVEVIASDGGVPVAAWKVWVCRGFRGLPSDGVRRAVQRY